MFVFGFTVRYNTHCQYRLFNALQNKPVATKRMQMRHANKGSHLIGYTLEQLFLIGRDIDVGDVFAVFIVFELCCLLLCDEE